MVTLVYGHEVKDLPVTRDAKICADSLFTCYTDRQLRYAGQFDRVIVGRQRLEKAIQDEDVAEISRIRLDLRQAQHLVEKKCGVRYPNA